MKVSSKESALFRLQESLMGSVQDHLEDSRSALAKKSQSPIPDYKYAVSSLFSARRMRSRNSSILAEIQKCSREEVSDTSTLKKELNYFKRSFEVIKVIDAATETEAMFPITYKASQDDGVDYMVYVKNTGTHYCWGVDNKEPIVLALSLLAESAGNDNDALFLEEVFVLDVKNIDQNIPPDTSSNHNADHGKEKVFIVHIPGNILYGLDRRAYILDMRLYESKVEDGAVVSKDFDFSGSYAGQFIIQE